MKTNTHKDKKIHKDFAIVQKHDKYKEIEHFSLYNKQ